jgi:hypothetical protein
MSTGTKPGNTSSCVPAVADHSHMARGEIAGETTHPEPRSGKSMLEHGSWPAQFYANYGPVDGCRPTIYQFARGSDIRQFEGLSDSACLKRQGMKTKDSSLASAVQNAMQRAGCALGLACLVTLALRHAAGQISHGVLPALAATHGYVLSFQIAAALLTVGGVLGLVLFDPRHRPAAQPARRAKHKAAADRASGGSREPRSAYHRPARDPSGQPDHGEHAMKIASLGSSSRAMGVDMRRTGKPVPPQGQAPRIGSARAARRRTPRQPEAQAAARPGQAPGSQSVPRKDVK